MRISGIYNRDDGYIQNITPGEKDRGANNHWALRGILQIKPSATFKATLTLRYAQADKERQAGIYTLAPACPNAQFQGEFLPAGQVCQYWNNYFGSSYNGGVPGSTANGYTNPAITPSQGGTPWATAGTGPAYVDRKIFGASLRLDVGLGAIDLTSISDYQHLNKYYIEGGDGVPELPYNFASPTAYAPFSTGPCPSPAGSVTCYASGTLFYQSADVDQYSQELRLAYATDRQSLIQYLLHGQARVASGILPPDHWAYRAPTVPLARDLAEAGRLLDAAGYPDPDGPGGAPRLSLVYKTSSDQFRVAVARVIAAQLAQVDVAVEVRPFEFGTFFADVKNRVPMTPQVKFRIASHSKMFAAIAGKQIWQPRQSYFLGSKTARAAASEGARTV